jgi:hypothetical protein
MSHCLLTRAKGDIVGRILMHSLHHAFTARLYHKTGAVLRAEGVGVQADRDDGDPREGEQSGAQAGGGTDLAPTDHLTSHTELKLP